MENENIFKYSKINDPEKFECNAVPVLHFSSPEDAQKAGVFINSLLEENKKLREALEFYANNESYESKLKSKSSFEQYEPSTYYPKPISKDKGNIAREALGMEAINGK